MSFTIEKIETNKIRINFEVAAETVNAALDKAFKKQVKKVNAPGFRKGKLPKNLFIKMYGIESLYGEALNFIINDAYGEAYNSEQFRPVDKFELDEEGIWDNFGKDKDFSFSGTVIVRPTPVLGQYKGIQVVKNDTSVTDESVEKELLALQEKNAEWVLKEDGVAEMGNMVILDFEETNPTADNSDNPLTSKNFETVLRPKSLPGDLTEKIIGKKAGIEFEVDVNLEENETDEIIYSKFTCLIHEIKEKQLPKLTDAFAVDVSDTVNSLAELKEEIKVRLQEELDRVEKDRIETAVMDGIIANTELEIPEVMIEAEIDFLVADMENRLKQQGLEMKMYLGLLGKSVEELRSEMRAGAIRRLQYELIIPAIAEAEKLEITEEEKNTEIELLSKQHNVTVEKVKEVMSFGVNIEKFDQDVLMKKVIKFIIDNKEMVDKLPEDNNTKNE